MSIQRDIYMAEALDDNTDLLEKIADILDPPEEDAYDDDSWAIAHGIDPDEYRFHKKLDDARAAGDRIRRCAREKMSHLEKLDSAAEKALSIIFRSNRNIGQCDKIWDFLDMLQDNRQNAGAARQQKPSAMPVKPEVKTKSSPPPALDERRVQEILDSFNPALYQFSRPGDIPQKTRLGAELSAEEKEAVARWWRKQGVKPAR